MLTGKPASFRGPSRHGRRPIFLWLSRTARYGVLLVLLLGFNTGLVGCGPSVMVRKMEVTAYCGCHQCCGWERGNWKYLKLNFWHRYYNSGPCRGKDYQGLTASGTKPHEPRHGLFTVDSLTHPWMIPFRLVFPWLWFSRDGTIAADTQYYPFGTRIYVDGYGYGVVEDRGSAIKGPDRLDLFFDSHSAALDWGRQHLEVRIYK